MVDYIKCSICKENFLKITDCVYLHTCNSISYRLLPPYGYKKLWDLYYYNYADNIDKHISGNTPEECLLKYKFRVFE